MDMHKILELAKVLCRFGGGKFFMNRSLLIHNQILLHSFSAVHPNPLPPTTTTNTRPKVPSKSLASHKADKEDTIPRLG